MHAISAITHSLLTANRLLNMTGIGKGLGFAGQAGATAVGVGGMGVARSLVGGNLAANIAKKEALASLIRGIEAANKGIWEAEVSKLVEGFKLVTISGLGMIRSLSGGWKEFTQTYKLAFPAMLDGLKAIKGFLLADLSSAVLTVIGLIGGLFAGIFLAHMAGAFVELKKAKDNLDAVTKSADDLFNVLNHSSDVMFDNFGRTARWKALQDEKKAIEDNLHAREEFNKAERTSEWKHAKRAYAIEDFSDEYKQNKTAIEALKHRRDAIQKMINEEPEETRSKPEWVGLGDMWRNLQQSLAGTVDDAARQTARNTSNAARYLETIAAIMQSHKNNPMGVYAD
jgi:gas vesicle protein